MTSTTEGLSRDLTTLVQSVAGVSTVYSTGPVAAAVVGSVIGTIRGIPVGTRLVGVSESDGGLEIVVVIGVSATEPAPVVCRRVHDAVVEYLSTRIGTPADIRVTVGRVG